MKAKVWHMADARVELRAEAELPPGIAGRVSGVALTYGVVDSYGTIFARGCANLTINQKVANRKVPLLMDHDRRVGSHVGVVTSMTDMADSLVMTAELFDTPEGRAALEYVKAVIAAGASTGFSIGFVPRKSRVVNVDGKAAEQFDEIELREVSITPMPAVPGADVTGARTDSLLGQRPRSDTELVLEAVKTMLNSLDPADRAELLQAYGEVSRAQPAGNGEHSPVQSLSPRATASAAESADRALAHPATSPATTTHGSAVSMAIRLEAVRQSFRHSTEEVIP